MLLETLLELVHPTRCAGCDLPGGLVCDRCADAVPVVERAWACERCGAPFGSINCTECWDIEFAFAAARCVGVLDRPLSRMVTLYKDGGERRLAGPLASMLADALGPWAGWAQALTWVPASRRGLNKRGFDHVGLFAQQVAQRLGLPVVEGLAVSSVGDQRRLGRLERRQRAVTAITAVPGARFPPHVLLLDDVLTTCATAEAASAAILASGAVEVRVGAIARAW